MNSNIKMMAKTGYIAKGSVYGLIGILTFLAAFNLGGEKSDQLQILDFLRQQTFGNLILLVLGAGLLCYSAWRFIQSILDPERESTDKKGLVKRAAFFVSGCIYLGLAVLAFWKVIDWQTSPDAGNSGGTIQSAVFSNDLGLIGLGAVGIIIICTGIYQFIRIYKQSFREKFDLEVMGDKRKKTVVNTAYIGMTSRGVIFIIMGFFALTAAINADPSEIKTTRDAFSFLHDSSYGSWIMGFVAAGFAGYAIYMFMMAKYRFFRD